MKSYSVKEIAELLHTNPETVRRWIRKGKLDATRGSSRKEGSSVSFAALQKFLEDSPKYAAAATASVASPAILASAGALAIIGQVVAAKMASENSIESASVDTVQICAYIDQEAQALKKSIARKREAVEQLSQEIERDTQSLEELKKLLNQINSKEIEESSHTNRSEHEEK